MQADAEAGVPPVFQYDPEAQSRVEEEVNVFFTRLGEALEEGGRPAVEAVLQEQGLSALMSEDGTLLNPSELEALRTATLSVIRQFMNRFMDSDQRDAVMSAGRMVYFEGPTERTQDVSDLLWGTEFFNEAVGSLPPSTCLLYTSDAADDRT